MLIASVLEVSVSNSCRRTVYRQIFFRRFLQAVQTNSGTSNYATSASLYIPCNSLFTSHAITQSHLVSTAASVIKSSINLQLGRLYQKPNHDFRIWMRPLRRITAFFSHRGICPVPYLVRNSFPAVDRILEPADWLI